MSTRYKFVMWAAIIIIAALLARIDNEFGSFARLHNEPTYPLTGTKRKIEKLYLLTSPDTVNGDMTIITDQGHVFSLHNGEAK